MSGTTDELSKFVTSALRQKREADSAESEGSSQMETECSRSSISRSSQFSSTNSSNERGSPSLNEILNALGEPQFEKDLFKDARQYATRKQRSCQKRVEPITEKQKREESSRNSRNYTRRNREEIEYCREKLECEKLKLEKSCFEANNLFGSQYAADIREKVYRVYKIVEKMSPNFEELSSSLNLSVLEDYYDAHEQKKKEAHNVAWKADVYTYEEEFEALKDEYEVLLTNKEEYIVEKGRTNFASAKSRLHQRVLRAELKRECYIMHCASENMEQKVNSLRNCDEQLKSEVWEVVVSKMDEILSALPRSNFEDQDYDLWQKIVEFFKEVPKKEDPVSDSENDKEEMNADDEDNTPSIVREVKSEVRDDTVQDQKPPLMVAIPVNRQVMVIRPSVKLSPSTIDSTSPTNSTSHSPPVMRYFIRKPVMPEKTSKPPLRMVCLRKVVRDGKTILQPVSVPNSSLVMRRVDGKPATTSPTGAQPSARRYSAANMIGNVTNKVIPMNYDSMDKRGSVVYQDEERRSPKVEVVRPRTVENVEQVISRYTETKPTTVVRSPIVVKQIERIEAPPRRNELLPVRRLYVRRVIPRVPYHRPGSSTMAIDGIDVAMPGALLDPNHQNPKIRLGKSVHDPNTISVGQLLKTKLKEEKQNPNILFDLLRKQLMNPTVAESSEEISESSACRDPIQ